MSFSTFDIYEGIRHGKDDDTDEEERVINVLPDSFTGLVVGKPGSGKSTLIESLLKNQNAFYKAFDIVLFISPRPIGRLDLKSDRWHQNLNLGWVYDSIKREKRFRSIKKVLVVMDDMSAELKASQSNTEMLGFFNNRRKWYDEHTEISILVSTQKFTQIPSVFRSQLQFLLFFNVPPEDFKVIQTQQIYEAPPAFKTNMLAAALGAIKTPLLSLGTKFLRPLGNVILDTFGTSALTGGIKWIYKTAADGLNALAGNAFKSVTGQDVDTRYSLLDQTFNSAEGATKLRLRDDRTRKKDVSDTIMNRFIKAVSKDEGDPLGKRALKLSDLPDTNVKVIKALKKENEQLTRYDSSKVSLNDSDSWVQRLIKNVKTELWPEDIVPQGLETFKEQYDTIKRNTRFNLANINPDYEEEEKAMNSRNISDLSSISNYSEEFDSIMPLRDSLNNNHLNIENILEEIDMPYNKLKDILNRDKETQSVKKLSKISLTADDIVPTGLVSVKAPYTSTFNEWENDASLDSILQSYLDSTLIQQNNNYFTGMLQRVLDKESKSTARVTEDEYILLLAALAKYGIIRGVTTSMMMHLNAKPKPADLEYLQSEFWGLANFNKSPAKSFSRGYNLRHMRLGFLFNLGMMLNLPVEILTDRQKQYRNEMIREVQKLQLLDKGSSGRLLLWVIIPKELYNREVPEEVIREAKEVYSEIWSAVINIDAEHRTPKGMEKYRSIFYSK